MKRTLSETEHLDQERKAANPIVTSLIDVYERALHDIPIGELLGWREHKELLDAYVHGLRWFINHEGGYLFYLTVQDYYQALIRYEYEDLPNINE